MEPTPGGHRWISGPLWRHRGAVSRTKCYGSDCEWVVMAQCVIVALCDGVPSPHCLSARCRRPRPTWWTTAASRPGTTPCSWASRPQTIPSRTKSPALYCSGHHLAFATLLVFFGGVGGGGLSVLLQSLFIVRGLWVGLGRVGCWVVGSCHYRVFTRSLNTRASSPSSLKPLLTWNLWPLARLGRCDGANDSHSKY